MQNNNLTNYFFVTTKAKDFWEKDFRQLLKNQGQFEDLNDTCLCFYKIGKFTGKYVPRYYQVQGGYLLYGFNVFYCLIYKNLKGYKKLDNVYLKSELLIGTYPYHLQLMHSGVYLDLYTTSKQDFDQFSNILECHCIMTDFSNKFTLMKQIGFGSSAKVYIARSLIDQEHYAIKRIDKQCSKRKQIQKSLLNEMMIMRELSHPNILRLYKVFETNKYFNFVLELIQGGELTRTIKQNSIRDARLICKNLALCVDYMHQKGVMHRDLKPQNILCKQNSTDILLADFGLATHIKHSVPIYTKCGTAGYIAPEIIQFQEGAKLYNEKCDIFSLGVIFYQLIYNSHPFKDINKQAILKRNLLVNYQFDETVKVPQSSKDLISAMLRVNPKLRPSASEILRHEFFSEVLNDFSFPSLQGSYIDASEFKKSSFNSQIGEVKLSTFQRGFKCGDQFMQSEEKEFKEQSGIWNKKIEFLPKPLVSSRPMLNLQKQATFEIRSKKISLFKQEFDSGNHKKMKEFEQTVSIQIPKCIVTHKMNLKQK